MKKGLKERRVYSSFAKIGVLLLAVSVYFSMSNLAQAVTQEYSEHWKATENYNVGVVWNPKRPGVTSVTRYICLGPSTWDVTGKVGGLTYEEFWTSGISTKEYVHSQTEIKTDLDPNVFKDMITGAFSDVAKGMLQGMFYVDWNNPKFGECEPGGELVNGDGTKPYGGGYFVLPAGQYGAIITHGGGDSNYFEAIRSLPQEWNIKGWFCPDEETQDGTCPRTR